MTKNEAAIVMTYTGICMLERKDLSYYYDYIEKIMGRPVFTHEISSLTDELRAGSREDFINLCANLTE